MAGELSKIFHRRTDKDFVPGELPTDPKSWPKEWTTVLYKEYPRMERICLPKSELPKKGLDEILAARRSSRKLNPGAHLELEELAAILASAGLDAVEGRGKRFYPSGGQRYPLETYVAVFRVRSVPPGIYHYNLKEHALETLTKREKHLDDFKATLSYPWSKDLAAGIVITAVWDRNFIKYGDQGYRLVLLEAGHLMQNINLVSAALGIKSCDLAGFSNPRMNKLLDIEHEGEDSLYLTVMGK